MRLRVLIVDDSPLMRKFIGRVLTMAGFEIAQTYEAGDGKQALACLDRNPVDLVLTDISMPVMDGEELLEEMQKTGMLAKIPAVVISTDATDARIHRMVEIGARGYVTKPFAPEALRERLKSVLGVRDGR